MMKMIDWRKDSKCRGFIISHSSFIIIDRKSSETGQLRAV
jgi:hypothetical protein